MILVKICSILIILVLGLFILILAEHSNGINNNNNNNNNLNGQMNGININGNSNTNLVEEEDVAECTRCGDSRLVGCMRGKCYYRCYRRCTLGNLTYQEALRFTLPGY